MKKEEEKCQNIHNEELVVVDNQINDACVGCIFLSVAKRHQICKICQVYYLGSMEQS